MTDIEWDELIRDLGSYRERVDACYIPTCDSLASIKLLGKESNFIRFYCKQCAGELIKTSFFQKVN